MPHGSHPLREAERRRRRSLRARLQQLFTKGFTAMDIAEPLLSVDAGRSAAEARTLLDERGMPLIGVRRHGSVTGYALLEELADGTCTDHEHPLVPETIAPASAPYADVIDVLTRSPFCLVSFLDEVCAVITRDDFEKPSVRMWLFGMITIVEMFVVRTIEEQYPDDTWESAVTPRRLAKAQTLLEERQRRNQSARLLDCLQFPDKLRILLQDPAMREDVGAASMRHAKQMIKDFEALRNDLAHAQQITTDNWDVIVLLAGRIDRLMTRV